MLIFPEDLCNGLVDLGFQVVRFDNRDTGLSTHLTGVPAPGWFKTMIRPSSVPYRLEDMAEDAHAVMDALGWRSARIWSATLRIPTLVLQGEDDPVIRLMAGQATAAAIPGARLVMGHDLPRQLWPSILEQIRALTLTR